MNLLFRDDPVPAAPRTMRELLDDHIATGEPLTQNIFRYGSEAWCEMIRLARELYRAGELSEVSEEDYVLLESDAGERGMYNGMEVLLDVPEVNYDRPGWYSVFTMTNLVVTKIEFNEE